MHPVLFTIGDFPIATYGLLTALGFLTGAVVSVWLARYRGIDDVAPIDLLVVAILGAIVGGKGLYVLTQWGAFMRDPAGTILSRQGFVFLGGLVGAVSLCTWQVKRRNLPFWRMADLYGPAVPLGHALGRLGCVATGCCYGGQCDPTAWYGMRYPVTLATHGEIVSGVSGTAAVEMLRSPTAQADLMGGFALLDHAEQGVVPFSSHLSAAVFPVQLMESALLLLLGAGLLWLFFRPGGWYGRVFLAYVGGYSLIRFAMEFFRGDLARGVLELGPFAISTSQALSLLLLLGVMGLWPIGRRGGLPGQGAAVPPEFAREATSAPSAARETSGGGVRDIGGAGAPAPVAKSRATRRRDARRGHKQ
jgi:phosphatidylglycerol:prolipoprotein diacylglycerol transferase